MARGAALAVVAALLGWLIPSAALAQADTSAPTQLRGTLRSVPDTQGWGGTWLVDGTAVVVAAQTRVVEAYGAVGVGAEVDVVGRLRADDAIVADLVVVVRAAPTPTRMSGTLRSVPDTQWRIGTWLVDGTAVIVTPRTRVYESQGPVAVGAVVNVVGGRRADGSIVAEWIVVREAAPTPVQMRGAIQALPATQGRIGAWLIEGRTIHVTAETLVVPAYAAAAVGAAADVVGLLRADGSIAATLIVILSAPS